MKKRLYTGRERMKMREQPVNRKMKGIRKFTFSPKF